MESNSVPESRDITVLSCSMASVTFGRTAIYRDVCLAANQYVIEQSFCFAQSSCFLCMET
jgi:hypothetical protein